MDRNTQSEFFISHSSAMTILMNSYTARSLTGVPFKNLKEKIGWFSSISWRRFPIGTTFMLVLFMYNSRTVCLTNSSRWSCNTVPYYSLRSSPLLQFWRNYDQWILLFLHYLAVIADQNISAWAWRYTCFLISVCHLKWRCKVLGFLTPLFMAFFSNGKKILWFCYENYWFWKLYRKGQHFKLAFVCNDLRYSQTYHFCIHLNYHLWKKFF